MTKKNKGEIAHIIPCLGLTDEALSQQGKLLGYVGFHEFDGYIPILRLRSLMDKPAKELQTRIYCLKTGYGYHFISFEIMDTKQRKHWAEIMQKDFPSDYLQMDKEAKHRVLRLSEKGKNPPPSFLFAIGLKPVRPLSLGHIHEYLKRDLIPEKAFGLYEGCHFELTRVDCCVYLAKNKEEE
jgi:hypothetical protein